MGAEQIWETWAEVSAIAETATSGDGSVTVTADATGAVLGMRLDPRGYRRLDATALADTIVATIAEAAGNARRRAFVMVAPLLPPGATFENTDLAFDPLKHHISRVATMDGSPTLFPEQTNSTLNQLGSVSDRMAADWGAAKAEIAGMAGRLGQGELGAAFVAAYRQLATEVADVADQCCQRPSEFTAVGNQAVNAFVTVDDDYGTGIQQTTT